MLSEPGFYKNGEFGIRIEDIVQIVPAEIENDFGGRGALTFQTVTMCPIQTAMINPKLLSEKEVSHKPFSGRPETHFSFLFVSQKTHLNDYHTTVRKTLTPLLGDDEYTIIWLNKETQPI